VKKTEDKQVATGIPKTAYKTAYCSVCKAQYFSPKMQCPMCNTMVHAMAPTSGVGKNNVVGSSHTDTQHSGVEPKLLHQVALHMDADSRRGATFLLLVPPHPSHTRFPRHIKHERPKRRSKTKKSSYVPD
jgi:hypothetical protein